jgi:hypothetical protein
MKQTLLVLTSIFIFFTTKAQQVIKNDLQTITGNWTGQLTYLNYGDSKEVSIKATLAVEMKKRNLFVLNFDYPDEAGHGSKEKYHIKNKGRYINNQLVTGRSIQEDGSIKIILEEKGKDGNDQKPATFQHVLIIGKTNFSLAKLVKFDGEEDFFQRNQYVFSRE